MQHGKDRLKKKLGNNIVKKTFQKKRNEYCGISSKIKQFQEIEKELANEEDAKEYMEKVTEKRKMLKEIGKLIESKRQEYIINIYEAQQIISGVYFLTSNGYVHDVEAERLRFEAIKLAIRFKIRPEKNYSQSDILHQKPSNGSPSDLWSLFEEIVTVLEDCIIKLEKYKKSGKSFDFINLVQKLKLTISLELN